MPAQHIELFVVGERHSQAVDARLDGIEIAMKGGQVGGDDYFDALRDGLTA